MTKVVPNEKDNKSEPQNPTLKLATQASKTRKVVQQQAQDSKVGQYGDTTD